MDRHRTLGPRIGPAWTAFTALAFLPLLLVGCQQGEPDEGEAGVAEGETPVETPGLTVADVGFAGPESMLHDTAADVYLVSNLNGPSTEKDDNGFISRLSPEGTVEELRWIDGSSEDVTLHAPKGMGILGDTLYVADIDCVRYFHRETGAPVWELCFQEATFLNDITVGPEGSVFVSDTGLEDERTDAVYRITPERMVARMVHGEGLGRPNGLAVDSEGVVVVTFGSGEIYRLGLDGTRTNIVTESPGQLDGVVTMDDGSLLVSTWGYSAVHRLFPGGQVQSVAEEVQSPADIGYDRERSRVLIPQLQLDQVQIRELPPTPPDSALQQ